MKDALLLLAYFAGRAFGWCIIGFVTSWALFFGISGVEIQLTAWAVAGIVILVISELAFLKIGDEK